MFEVYHVWDHTQDFGSEVRDSSCSELECGFKREDGLYPGFRFSFSHTKANSELEVKNEYKLKLQNQKVLSSEIKSNVTT